ncbi:MAG: CHRD domain-containing protein [Verrucomicrobiota bacterium]
MRKAAGGRGDNTGFHGNGNDAYVSVVGSGTTVWLTVLNADGSIRYSKSAADDLTLLGVGRVDAAIDASGSVIVVFEAKYAEDRSNLVFARRFDPSGDPTGPSVYVSEKEVPGSSEQPSEGPRIAWRNGEVAIAWESKNDLDTINPDDGLPKTVVALRLFSTTPPREYSIGLNFGADEANNTSSGSLASTNVAGVPSVAQANWNNLTLLSGTNSAVVADANGNAEPTLVTVNWSSANTWSSTGRGEENNGFPTNSPDRTLMTGYLDTGSATTTRVQIASIPTRLTTNGYDLYVYASGGVAARGGSYRLLDGVSGLPITDYVRVQSGTNLSSYVEVSRNLGATNPAGGRIFGVGNYIVFRGLTRPNVVVQAVTGPAAGGLGFSGTPRAPINAIQLVAPATGSTLEDVTQPGDAIVSSDPDANSPAAERVPNAIDNDSATKYLNFGKDGNQTAPFAGPVGLTVTPKAGPSIVNGIAFTSANDAPERDPASYKLEGSNDGTNFVAISEGTVPPFSGRFIRQEILFTNPPTAFQVTLSGASERPNPVTTPATGSGTLTLAGDQLAYAIKYSGLSAAATAGHIHGPATTEQAVGVLIAFPNVTGTEGTLSGTLTLNAATIQALQGGLAYVNIHTGNNPGGEIRGQVVPATFTTYRLTIPTVANAATANSMQFSEVELLGRVFAAPAAPTIAISRSADKITITYQGTLNSSDSVTGPFAPVAGATSPFTVTPDGAAKFYIAR